MGSAGSKRRQSARLFGPRPRRKQARNAEIVTHTPIYGALKFYENLRFPAYQKRRVRLPPSWTGSTAWWCWCSSWWRHHKNYLFHQLCVNSSLEASRSSRFRQCFLGNCIACPLISKRIFWAWPMKEQCFQLRGLRCVAAYQLQKYCQLLQGRHLCVFHKEIHTFKSKLIYLFI